jgi:hypothetical protein
MTTVLVSPFRKLRQLVVGKRVKPADISCDVVVFPTFIANKCPSPKNI